MTRIKNSFIIFALFINGYFLNAQYTDIINSNRPGFSDGAYAVGTNVFQLELGPYLIKEKHTRLKYEVSGFGVDFSVRYGFLFEQLELILSGIYQNDTFTDKRFEITLNNDRLNFKTLSVGAKYLVYDPYKNSDIEQPNLYSYHANRGFKWKSLIPAVAVYAGINFDPKMNPFTAASVEGIHPVFGIATQNNFTDGWVFVLNARKDRIGSNQSDFYFIVTLTKALNKKWALFGEVQSIKSDFYADDLFRFGGAFLWGKNFQIDTSVTLNTKDSPSIFQTNIGISYRFDFHKDELETENTL